MTSLRGGGGGGDGSVTEGGEGVQNSLNLCDVIYERPLVCNISVGFNDSYTICMLSGSNLFQTRICGNTNPEELVRFVLLRRFRSSTNTSADKRLLPQAVLQGTLHSF